VVDHDKQQLKCVSTTRGAKGGLHRSEGCTLSAKRTTGGLSASVRVFFVISFCGFQERVVA